MPTSQKNQAGSDTKSNRGGRMNSNNSNSNFANMDDNKQREIASKGGRSLSGHSKSRTH